MVAVLVSFLDHGQPKPSRMYSHFRGISTRPCSLKVNHNIAMIVGTMRRAYKRSRFRQYFSTGARPPVTQTHFKNGIKLNTTSEASIDTLVIFCGWMSSTDRQLKRYLDYYHRNGIHTLQFSVGTSHVFNPGAGTKHMEYILQTTLDLEPKNIVFHHFSIGGFLYGQMLRIFKDSPKNKGYGGVIPKIKGQIFDSPPDMHSIPEGLAAHFFPSKSHPLHFLVKICVEMYMKLTAESNGREWKASSEIFHANFLAHAPSLWYYSTADPVSRYEDCEKVIESWKGLGMDVTAVRWDNTPHIQHGRKDPDRYFGELDIFLRKIEVLP